MKQFANIDEYRVYYKKWEATRDTGDLHTDSVRDDSAAVTAQLIADGYDPNNLLADGHAYGAAPYPHKDGWMYRDEIDPEMISRIDPSLIRER